MSQKGLGTVLGAEVSASIVENRAVMSTNVLNPKIRPKLTKIRRNGRLLGQKMAICQYKSWDKGSKPKSGND